MIEIAAGLVPSDSPFQNKSWVWGADGIHALRSRLDDTVVVIGERSSSFEIDMIEENQYVAPPP